jgi:hypothetical protein
MDFSAILVFHCGNSEALPKVTGSCFLKKTFPVWPVGGGL